MHSGYKSSCFFQVTYWRKVPLPGQQPACKGAAEEEALYMDFLEQEYSFLVASGAERNMGWASLVNSGF